MNKRIKELWEECKTPDWSYDNQTYDHEKFAELIIEECAKLNRQQSFELLGVIVDVEQGLGFDAICLNTVKRVREYLAGGTLEEHFGIENENQTR